MADDPASLYRFVDSEQTGNELANFLDSVDDPPQVTQVSNLASGITACTNRFK